MHYILYLRVVTTQSEIHKWECIVSGMKTEKSQFKVFQQLSIFLLFLVSMEMDRGNCWENKDKVLKKKTSSIQRKWVRNSWQSAGGQVALKSIYASESKFRLGWTQSF